MIQMTELGQLQAVDVRPQSGVCGQETPYTFMIVPNTDMENGDTFFITFPNDIELPDTRYLRCSGQRYKVLALRCIRTADHEMRIALTSVSNINAGTQFWFRVEGV